MMSSKKTSDPLAETDKIVNSLWEKFPEIAKRLIRESQDMTDPKNQSFFENPDAASEHETNWHEWGIITHTKNFEKKYREELPGLFAKWGIFEKIRKALNNEIDGVKKNDLLNIAAVLHDLGKFTQRKLTRKEDGAISVSFKTHEVASGRIIRSPKFLEMLKTNYGLSEPQIEYIARCAELHYELGIFRDKMKGISRDYTIAFAKSGEFKKEVKDMLSHYGSFSPEIGILFLADSLAKTSINISVEDDEGIEAADAMIKRELEKRGLPQKLLKAVKNAPVNCRVGEEYLKIWASGV